MRHLRPEQLVGFRDGESPDLHVAEHLAICPECQRELGESRWSLTLRRSEVGRDERPHPSPDELAALQDSALASPSARSVERHLRSCDRCLALYQRLRNADAQAGFPVPPQALLRTTRGEFAPRPLIHLGSLRLRRLDDALALSYWPEATQTAYGSGGWPRPGRSLFGSIDFSRDADRVEDSLLEAAESDLQRTGMPPERRRRLGAPGAALDAPALSTAQIEAADLRILIEAVEQDDDVSLTLTLHRTDRDEPARGLGIRLRPETGDPIDIQTDESGIVRIPFPAGASLLEIRGRTPLYLDLQNPS